MSPLTKCDTIAPILEINKIRFRHIDVHADMWYKNGIDRSRHAWAVSAWKRRTTFAPTQGLHISGYVPSYVPRHRYCNSHISSHEWKIWIITTRQLRVYVTAFCPYFSHPYFIKAMEAHIGQHISEATEMQTLCWSKTRPSFSGADNSYISWPINTIFVPRIGMYIRINIPEMDFIYLKMCCNSVIFCQRGIFFDSPCSRSYMAFQFTMLCTLPKKPDFSEPLISKAYQGRAPEKHSMWLCKLLENHCD